MGTKNIFKKIGFLMMSVGFIGCAHASDSSSNSSDKLTDANIAAIVVGANKIDISAGKIALDRSEDKRVRGFAQRMVTDHQGVLNAAVELVTRLGVTPENNDLVFALSKQSAEHEAKLKSLTGKEFDKLYIDHEVAYHEAVIGVIKTQLIPGSSNQELKDMLTSVLPAFDAHLSHCKNIQAGL
jgi:putative membrane protein